MYTHKCICNIFIILILLNIKGMIKIMGGCLLLKKDSDSCNMWWVIWRAHFGFLILYIQCFQKEFELFVIIVRIQLVLQAVLQCSGIPLVPSTGLVHCRDSIKIFWLNFTPKPSLNLINLFHSKFVTLNTWERERMMYPSVPCLSHSLSLYQVTKIYFF